MPVAAFVPGGLIKSADDNSNFSDIATALTQSLATTGVSTMTGPINAAAGTVGAPSYTFNGASKTGFYLAGANQIGWASNGIQGALFNADTSITFAGAATFGGVISATKGTIPIGGVMDFAGSAAPAGWLLCFGQQISTTTYAALFAVLGTTYGSGAGTFGIPDYRGRATFGQDNMGGSAAGRITATLNFDGTVLGGSGGSQSQTLTLGQLPTGITVTGSLTPNTVTANGAVTTFSNNTGGATQWQAWATGVSVVQVNNPTTTLTSNNTSGSAHTILNPAIITNKIIYAGI